MPGTPITIPQAGDEVAVAWGQAVAKGLNGIQAGTVTVPGITSSANGTAVVTFPLPFASPPVVSLVSGSTQIQQAAGTITATTLTVVARRWDGSSSAYTATVQWVAIGVLA